LNIGDDQRREM
jgi:hypothetical protein